MDYTLGSKMHKWLHLDQVNAFKDAFRSPEERLKWRECFSEGSTNIYARVHSELKKDEKFVNKGVAVFRKPAIHK